MKVVFLFGGSGYISYFLINRLIELNKFDKYFIYDIKEPHYYKNLPPHAIYEKCDVRKPIKQYHDEINTAESWIFNLAAIHREPGHQLKEYFETNVHGAKNINVFAEKLKIKNLFFASSIAPYGMSKNVNTESSELYPSTPYGISKAMAELIHKTWLENNDHKRLIIVRPCVIYGPNDPGNIYRTIMALKKGFFILPNGGYVIKAYGYVFGLIDSIIFTMEKSDREITYNYAEYPLLNLKEMTKEIKYNLNFKKPTLSLPVPVLVVLAKTIQFTFKLMGKNSDLHPIRVKKAAFPTNIKPQYLIDSGFCFKYGFTKSLIHWKSTTPEDFE